MRILLTAVALVLTVFHGHALQERRVVRIAAERFSFTPSRIELEVGEEVEFLVTSDDTAHGLRIEGTGIDLTIPKRGAGEIRVPVRIDQPGRYRFECSRICGAGHDFMRGELIVRDRNAGRGSR